MTNKMMANRLSEDLKALKSRCRKS